MGLHVNCGVVDWLICQLINTLVVNARVVVELVIQGEKGR